MQAATAFHQRAANLPAYWFVKLETAADEGLFEEAAEAQRELRRLGYEVKYRRPNRVEPVLCCGT